MTACIPSQRAPATLAAALMLLSCWPVVPLAGAGAEQATTKERAIYTLQTQCRLQATTIVPCTVQAIDEGQATLYRHTFRDGVRSIRITDSPLRMTRWDASSQQWLSLNSASARFSTNTVCFNGVDLCVVNPNDLNSVRQERAAAMVSRDLVKVHFGSDGRINATCYDDGCEVSLK